jgi:hypothetical protein
MIIENNRTDINELSAKIIGGLRIAVRQLIETSAANDKSLIIGDNKGGFKSVPAKELLKKLPK